MQICQNPGNIQRRKKRKSAKKWTQQTLTVYLFMPKGKKDDIKEAASPLAKV